MPNNAYAEFRDSRVQRSCHPEWHSLLLELTRCRTYLLTSPGLGEGTLGHNLHGVDLHRVDAGHLVAMRESSLLVIGRVRTQAAHYVGDANRQVENGAQMERKKSLGNQRASVKTSQKRATVVTPKKQLSRDLGTSPQPTPLRHPALTNNRRGQTKHVNYHHEKTGKRLSIFFRTLCVLCCASHSGCAHLP